LIRSFSNLDNAMIDACEDRLLADRLEDGKEGHVRCPNEAMTEGSR
jgi:hypothetical protein